MGQEVTRQRFPVQWQNTPPVLNLGRTVGGGGRAPPAQRVTFAAPLPAASPRPYVTSPTLSSPQRQLPPLPAGIPSNPGVHPPANRPDRSQKDFSHLHPILKEAFAEYHRVFGGRLMFGRLCKAAGVSSQAELPYLRGYFDVQKGKHSLCFSHVCGFCWAAESNNCKFIQGHVPAGRIPDGYAKALRNRLAPGIAWMLANREQVLRDDAELRQARKRRKQR